MNDKLKLVGLSAVAIIAVAVVCVMGYRYFGPQPQLPTVKIVSASDLVRLEKSNPSALTEDQRHFLAAIPESQKKELLTKPTFSIGEATAQKPKTSN